MNSKIEEILSKRIEDKAKQEVHSIIGPVRRALANMRTDSSDRAEISAMMDDLNAIEASMIKARVPYYMQEAAEVIADQLWAAIK